MSWMRAAKTWLVWLHIRKLGIRTTCHMHLQCMLSMQNNRKLPTSIPCARCQTVPQLRHWHGCLKEQLQGLLVKVPNGRMSETVWIFTVVK